MSLISNLKIGHGHIKKELTAISNESTVDGLQERLIYCDNQNATFCS